MSAETSHWDVALDAAEQRLGQWHAVVGGGPLPSGADWPVTSLPPSLVDRATRVLAELGKLEAEMATRAAALNAAISKGHATPRPTRTPLFVDRRA